MKNCWKILEIGKRLTSILSAALIRRCYRPFIQKPIPQGFKQLRQAYEEALRIAQSPAKSVWQPEEMR